MMSTDIEKMLTSTDPSERREACFAVQEEGAANFVDDVILLLKDKDMGVREAALNTLEAFGGLRVAAGVVPLLKDSDPSVRNIASELLETLGEDSIDPVMNLLHDDNDGVRKSVV